MYGGCGGNFFIFIPSSSDFTNLLELYFQKETQIDLKPWKNVKERAKLKIDKFNIWYCTINESLIAFDVK